MFTKAEFDAVRIGQHVGVVCGPGEFPRDNAGTVVEKVENRWGFHVVVEFEGETQTGRTGRDTCHGFTKVGIGWYDLTGSR